MDKIIVYLDDAAYAQQQLAPMMGTGTPETHWILVACAPRMSQHVSKWVSYAAREHWRAKWSGELFAQLVPALQQRGDTVTPVVAAKKTPLLAQTQQLLLQHGGARVLDARRPKLGQDQQPVVQGQPMAAEANWTVPGAAVGLAAVMLLAAD